MEVSSAILGNIWVLGTTTDLAAFEARREAIREKFARVEVVFRDGPYLAGARFSAVDTAFASAFRYFDIFDGLPKVAAWPAALAARPSMCAAVLPDYTARPRAFLRRQGGVLTQRIAVTAG